jgi:DNA-binding SARP family transcriptional activator
MSQVVADVHIRLAGPLEVTAGGTRFDATAFPGRQGRLVFAALALARGPVDRNELADILWPNQLPSSWTRDLSAVISKLRAQFTGVAEVATGSGRWYAIEFPPATTIDVEEATVALERAERDRATGEHASALQDAERAAAILAEPFLAGDDSAWADDRRDEMRTALVRALVLRAEVLGEMAAPGAVTAAQALVELEPEREASHVQLMRAYLALGDRVEALRAYERLRRMLADDFGLFPSAAADQLMYLALGPEDAPASPPAPLPLPTPVVDARRTAIVGRDAELAQIDALFAPDATARIAVVVGPAGIGKSRLACEAAAQAHESGFVVVFGACSDDRTTPYRVIVDAFGSFRLAPGIDEDAALLADDVVRLLAGQDADPTPGRARTDIFAAVANALSRFTEQHVLLLVVDDVQWADTASAQLLENIVAVVPGVRVLATARSDDGHSEHVGSMLARLRTKDGAFSVPVGGLSVTDVAAALREHGAGDVDAALVHAVHRATGGNPLYVREVGRHLAVAGRPTLTADVPLLEAIGLPRGLAELIDANLARLGAPARRMLEVCAVIGGSIELGVLARACALPEADLAAAIDVTRRAGVLVESPADATALRFDHPLVREVLLHSLGSARRAQIHQRVAEAIEAYHHNDVDRFSAELAHHLAAAANVGSARDAMEFAARAGERANTVCAYDEAAHWFAHALRLARARGDDPATTARLLTALGDAQNHAGDAAAAQVTLFEAIDVARAAQDTEQFADTVLGLGGVLVDEGFEGGAVDDRLIALLHESIGTLPTSSPLRARLLVRLASELHFAGDRAECLALCDEAERVVRDLDAPEALAAVLAARHYALYGSPDVPARIALLNEIQALRTRLKPHSRWARDYLELGDMDAVEASSARHERLIATEAIASERYYPAVLRSTLAALRGEFDVAEATAGEAAEVGRAASRGPLAVAGVWAAQIFAVRLFDGRLAELGDLVDASADATPTRPIWRAAAAFIQLELGDRERAALHYRQVRAHGLSRLPDTVDRPVTLGLLAWVAADVGSLADARELRRQLRPYRDFLLVLGTAAASACAGPASYPLAMLEARLGNHDAASALLAEAEQCTVRIGAVPWRDRIRREKQRMQSAEPVTA